MQPSDSLRTLAIGLIGGLLGALLVPSIPAVTAAVGDPINVGEIAKGNATTVLRADADPSLRIVNPSGDPALDLRVGQGNRPLLVDSNKRIPRLNADRVDGRNANQLLRASGGLTWDAVDQNGPAVTTTITAPTDGFLVMSGSITVSGSTLDDVWCNLGVKAAGSSTTDVVAMRSVVVHDPGAGHTNNGREVCATDAARPYGAGTYEISLQTSGRNTAQLGEADVSVVFVPFDGEGNPVTAGG